MDSSLVTSMVLQDTRELPLAIASALEIVRVAAIYGGTGYCLVDYYFSVHGAQVSVGLMQTCAWTYQR